MLMDQDGFVVFVCEIIRQWKIEGDNLILVSKKEKAHGNDINVLLNIGNGFIASGSEDKTIKIW